MSRHGGFILKVLQDLGITICIQICTLRAGAVALEVRHLCLASAVLGQTVI